MKRLFFILVGIIVAISSMAKENAGYDVIYWNSTDSLRAKVLTIGENVISYRIWSNLNGPVYTVSKSEIFAIRYANGTSDIFKETYQPKSRKVSQSVQNAPERASFIGGTCAIGYDVRFQFAFEPIIGYEFSDRFAMGAGFGVIVAADYSATAAMGIAEPFLRFCAWHNDLVFIDFKATAAFGFTRELDLCQVGVRPSLRFRIHEHCDIAADIGLFGAQYTIADGWRPAIGITATSAGIWVAYRF